MPRILEQLCRGERDGSATRSGDRCKHRDFFDRLRAFAAELAKFTNGAGNDRFEDTVPRAAKSLAQCEQF